MPFHGPPGNPHNQPQGGQQAPAYVGQGNPIQNLLQLLRPEINYLAPYIGQGISNINRGTAPVRDYLQGPFSRAYGQVLPQVAGEAATQVGSQLNPFQLAMRAFDTIETAFGPIGQNPRRAILGEQADLDVQNFIEDRVQAPASRMATAFGNVTLAPFVQGLGDILEQIAQPLNRGTGLLEQPGVGPRRRLPHLPPPSADRRRGRPLPNLRPRNQGTAYQGPRQI